MIKDKMTYRWLWSCLILGGLLLAACTDDAQEPSGQPDLPDQGSLLQLQAVTRTSGATQIGDATCPDIKAYLTTATEMMQIGDKYYGTFHYNTTTPAGWTSDISVKEERQYYLYGYMPASISGSATVPVGGNFSDGIDLTLTGIPSITTEDVSVIIGVQRMDAPLAGSATANVEEGNFSYLSGIVDKNYVNLLMGHLYAALNFSFKVDAAYAQLRTIHLKEVKMNSTYGNVNATIGLRKNRGITSSTYTRTTGSQEPEPLLEGGNKVLTTTKQQIGKDVYCAPGIFEVAGTSGNYLSITSTYDVYDKAGKFLKERTATNKISVTGLSRAMKKTLVLTIAPTYLYVLSDYDLDNPGVTVSGE